jgi:hypothetical protein
VLEDVGMTVAMRQVVRSIAQVAMGVVAGALLVGPVMALSAPGAAPAGSVQTRRTSCAAADFHPVDTRLLTKVRDGYVMRGFSDGDGFVTCMPDLPDGAVVTNVDFTYIDTDPGTDLRYCGLFRSDLRAGSAGAFQELAQLPPSGIATSVPVRRSDMTIKNATVNQGRYGYWLQCLLEGQGNAEDGVSPDNGLYGATVTYRISAANG